MFGIDPGLNIASVVLIAGRKVAFHKVIKGSDETFPDEFSRISYQADQIVKAITHSGFSGKVTIEEPIYSWGRKNPKGFAKSVVLVGLLQHMLRHNGFKTYLVNNKAAKKAAGSGANDKEAMIKAFKRETRQKIDKFPKYYRETIADAYFIARLGRTLYGS